MAQTIQVKRSTSTDTPTSLENGELAYAHTVAAPGKLYIGRPGSASGDVDPIGGKYYVDRSETAYNWGNHASAGYAAGSALANYLPLSGGTMTGNITLPDNGKLKLSNTASLYSTGNSTFLSEFGDGNLELLGHDIYFRSDSGGSDTDYFAKFIYNGGVELYYDGTKTTETTSTGLRVATVDNPTVEILNTDTTIEANQLLGTLQFKADDDTGNIIAGHIQLKSTQDWDQTVTNGDYGSAMHLGINESGAGNGYTDRLVLDTDGVTVSEGLDVGGDTAITGSVTVSSDLEVSGGTTLAALSVGDITTSGYIRGPADMVIDPSAYDDATGSLTILGDLVVEGTTTTINSTVVEIADERVVVNREQAGTPTSALVAGLEVERGDSNNAFLLWREALSGWYVSDGGTGTGSDFELLHANNWGSAYTGAVDGGTF